MTIRYHTDTQEPDVSELFVFGSNLRGAHGKGAAKTAKEYYGAVYGVGIGRTGNSYAIPTKDEYIKTLPLYQIQNHVNEFIRYVISNPQYSYYITRIGCGLAGYKDSQIAPLFSFLKNRNNCNFPVEWKQYLEGVNNVSL